MAEQHVYSNAFNFADFLKGGVDPRTGLYTCSLNLGSVESCALNGPSVPVALFFNPLNPITDDMGAGWSIAQTQFDIVEKKLTLSSGESFKAQYRSTHLAFDEMKLETVKVLRSKSRPKCYEVLHKSGLREELEVFPGSDIAVPMRLVEANGTQVEFHYVGINQRPALVAIKEGQRTLLSIERSSSAVTLTRFPGTSCEASYVLHLNNHVVRQVELPEGGQWRLSYARIGEFRCLVRVDSPLGAAEVVTYAKSGHRLAAGAPLAFVPHVVSHTEFPGQDQPPITRNYEFSGRNYLGFNDPNTQWSAEGDVLYRSAADYRYSSKEILMSANQVHTTTLRTYNKYHLLVEEDTRCQDALVRRSTEYHLDPRRGFAGQPAQFRMPKVQTLRYEVLSTGAFRTEVTRTDYDESGNLLRSETPDGTVLESRFHPAEGGPGCPADPLGFVRFEALRVVTPGKGAGAAITTTHFDYVLLPGIKGSGLHTVVASSERLYDHAGAGERLLVRTEQRHFDTPHDASLHGRVKAQTVTRGEKTTQTLFAYQLQDERLICTQTLVGFDGTRQTCVETQSALTGELLVREDEEGKLAYEYDRLGRVTRETVGADSPWSASRSTEYQLYDATTGQPAAVLTTDTNGVQQRCVCDGLGRTIRIDEQDSDAAAERPWRTVYTAQHDAVGRLASEIASDWLDGEPLALRSEFSFDAWGAITTTRHSDGRSDHRTYDPISRREETWAQGMGKTVTHYNVFGKPDSIEAFDTAGQSQSKWVYSYDGRGRTVSQTDPVGNRTTFEYDVFDRLVRSLLPDGHAVQTEYAAHSPGSLPTQVSVAGQTLAQQAFDGLGRLTRMQMGNRLITRGYRAGVTHPTSEKTAAGQTIRFEYQPALGGLMTRRTGSLLDSSYQYDARLGLPTGCQENGRQTRRLEYHPSGRLKTETYLSDQGEQTSRYRYSLAGRPDLHIDVLGNRQRTRYDAFGRPQSLECGEVTADFAYDLRGQLARIRMLDPAGSVLLATHLTYDDLGREHTRRFEIRDQSPRLLTMLYTPAGKLASKTLTEAHQLLREETFAYDSRGRLSDYRCRGSQLPQDPFGKSINRQLFEFDALDNILCVTTEFPGGTNRMTFAYDDADPTRLTGVSHSHPDYPPAARLAYDADGRMTIDDQGRRLAYDELGRLVQVADASGEVLRGYRYDAWDRLVEWTTPTGPGVQRYYRDGQLLNERAGQDQATCLRGADLLLGRAQAGAPVQAYGTDLQQNVLASAAADRFAEFAYAPYGHRPGEGGLFSVLGFCGEQLDPVTGLYLLGNGYRAYSPTLMRFLSPDSLSPFGAGGLNPYAYCGGDPINRTDPTGHFWKTLLGIGLAIAGFVLSVVTMGVATPLAIAGVTLAAASAVLGVAGAIVDEVAPGSVAGEILGWASLATGLASAGVGVAGLGRSAVRAGNKLANAFKSGLSPTGDDVARAAKAVAGSSKPGRGGFGGKIGGKGAQKAANARNAAPQVVEEPKPWRMTQEKLRGFKELNKAETGKWKAFEQALEEGMHPKDAANMIGGADFKQLKGSQFQIRLSLANRVTFEIDYKARLTSILQVGGHT